MTKFVVSRSIKLNRGNYEMTDYFISVEGERPIQELEIIADRAMLATIHRVYLNSGEAGKTMTPKIVAKKHGLVRAFDKLPEEAEVDDLA